MSFPLNKPPQYIKIYTRLTFLFFLTRNPPWCHQDGSQRKDLWEEKDPRPRLHLPRLISQSKQAWYEGSVTVTFISVLFGLTSDSGTSAISRVLRPSPNSHDEALLGATVTTEEEQAAETTEEDEDAESDDEGVAEAVDEDDDDGKCLM